MNAAPNPWPGPFPTFISPLLNGDLIAAVEGEIDILVTADKNLRYQQNLSGRKLAIVELPFNSWRRLRLMFPRLRICLETIKAGEYMVLEEVPNP